MKQAKMGKLWELFTLVTSSCFLDVDCSFFWRQGPNLTWHPIGRRQKRVQTIIWRCQKSWRRHQCENRFTYQIKTILNTTKTSLVMPWHARITTCGTDDDKQWSKCTCNHLIPVQVNCLITKVLPSEQKSLLSSILLALAVIRRHPWQTGSIRRQSSPCQIVLCVILCQNYWDSSFSIFLWSLRVQHGRYFTLDINLSISQTPAPWHFQHWQAILRRTMGSVERNTCRTRNLQCRETFMELVWCCEHCHTNPNISKTQKSLFYIMIPGFISSSLPQVTDSHTCWDFLMDWSQICVANVVFIWTQSQSTHKMCEHVRKDWCGQSCNPPVFIVNLCALKWSIEK